MPKSVLIAGRGVAALVCAQRLAAVKYKVACYGPPMQQGATILLGKETLELLQSQFPAASLHRLGHPILYRDIQWGKTEPTQILSKARVFHLPTLVNHLEHSLLEKITLLPERPQCNTQWFCQIDATGRQAHLAREIAAVTANTYGKRCAISVPVKLHPRWEDRVAMELLPAGWLFLCPTGCRTGLLQFMHPNRPKHLLQTFQNAWNQSHMITKRISGIDGDAFQVLFAAPQILDVLGSSQWLAVGAAAISFDPLCGDGVGQAIRSSLLACAVLQTAGDIPFERALRHYSLRHRHSFAWHLHHLERFYDPLRDQIAWQTELEKTQTFLESKAAQTLLHHPRFEYQMIAMGDTRHTISRLRLELLQPYS